MASSWESTGQMDWYAALFSAGSENARKAAIVARGVASSTFTGVHGAATGIADVVRAEMSKCLAGRQRKGGQVPRPWADLHGEDHDVVARAATAGDGDEAAAVEFDDDAFLEALAADDDPAVFSWGEDEPTDGARHLDDTQQPPEDTSGPLERGSDAASQRDTDPEAPPAPRSAGRRERRAALDALPAPLP